MTLLEVCAYILQSMRLGATRGTYIVHESYISKGGVWLPPYSSDPHIFDFTADCGLLHAERMLRSKAGAYPILQPHICQRLCTHILRLSSTPSTVDMHPNFKTFSCTRILIQWKLLKPHTRPSPPPYLLIVWSHHYHWPSALLQSNRLYATLRRPSLVIAMADEVQLSWKKKGPGGYFLKDVLQCLIFPRLDVNWIMNQILQWYLVLLTF